MWIILDLTIFLNSYSKLQPSGRYLAFVLQRKEYIYIIIHLLLFYHFFSATNCNGVWVGKSCGCQPEDRFKELQMTWLKLVLGIWLLKKVVTALFFNCTVVIHGTFPDSIESSRIRTISQRSRLTIPWMLIILWDVKEPTHYSKRVGWSRCCGCLSYVNGAVSEVGHLCMGPWSPLAPFPSGQL